MLYIMSFLLAMVITIAWVPVFGRLAKRWLVVDMPGARKVHAVPIPRVGGVAMMLGVLVAAALIIPLGRAELSFLVAAVVLTIFGALDDRFDLDYRIKLIGQLLAAGIVVIGGALQVRALTFDDSWLLPEWLSLSLTLFFLVGITNAINLADGLDGLAGGTTFLCLCAVALLAHGGGQIVCAALALAFAGAVLGFLRFNTYPASVFMGDAGSQVLGFSVGVLSIGATQGGVGAVSAATPILLLALPILDTLSVMVQRISEGRSPFSPDKNHIHHRLLDLGFDHHEAVIVIYAIQADLFLFAYWLRFESDLIIIGAVSVFFLATIFLLQIAQRLGWRFRTPDARQRHTPVAHLLTLLRRPQCLPRWSYLLVAASSGAYALSVLSQTVSLSTDVVILVTALLAVTILLLALLRVKPLNLVEKAALYVTAAVLVYLDGLAPADDDPLYGFKGVAILMAAAGTILRLRLVADRRFELTPLDVIVLFVALVVPSLAGSLGMPHDGVLSIAKLVVLFYALEVLVSRVEVRVVWLRVAQMAVLTALAVRPLIAP